MATLTAVYMFLHATITLLGLVLPQQWAFTAWCKRIGSAMKDPQ